MNSPKYMTRLSTTLNMTTNTSNVDRIWAWRASIDMFKEHPINGVGLDNWEWYYKNGGYKYAEESQNLPHAHSNYMQLLAETGTIGFLGLLYFYRFSLIVPFKRWIKEHNPCDLIFLLFFSRDGSLWCISANLPFVFRYSNLMVYSGNHDSIKE